MDFINNIKSAFQTTDKIKWIDINKIKIDKEIEGIFVQNEAEVQNIADNMIENQKKGISAFDPAHPIILAYSKEHPELNDIDVDGHHRYNASKKVGLTKVAVIYKSFMNRAELIKFVYEQQLLRRNLTENEVFNAWTALNKLKDENGKKAKTDSEIADELKISRRQVSKMKEVEKKAAPEVLESIKAGELTVNKVYTQLKQAEAESETELQKETAEKTDLMVDSDSKIDVKVHNHKSTIGNYQKGFLEGLSYVLESLICGKSTDDLQSELSDLKAGTKSSESLLNSLKLLKESYEQK